MRTLSTFLLLSLTMLGACADCPDAFELRERRVVRAGQRVSLSLPDGQLTLVGRERSTTLELEARGCRARGGASIVSDSLDDAAALRVAARHADVRAFVPAGTEVVVRHGSGNVQIRAVGPADVETRGGRVRIEQAIGQVRVEAGPGSLYVREVVGDVEVVDGPGAVFLEGVLGSVRVRDGSGGIHLREIEGDVLIEADGSGAVEARSIAGDVVVRAKSDDARMIRTNDVGGSVRLPNDR